MNVNEAKVIVIEVIESALEGEVAVTDDMQLIGGDTLLDSHGLVEACLALEDIADEHGFEFIWNSEAAMSTSRSMFRTVTSLAEEFSNQSEA
jgi:acyl carrier protein